MMMTIGAENLATNRPLITSELRSNIRQVTRRKTDQRQATVAVKNNAAVMSDVASAHGPTASGRKRTMSGW